MILQIGAFQEMSQLLDVPRYHGEDEREASVQQAPCFSFLHTANWASRSRQPTAVDAKRGPVKISWKPDVCYPKGYARAAAFDTALMIDRPKREFSVLVAEWLGEPVRDWASEWPTPAELAQQDFVGSARTDRLWPRRLAGTVSNGTHIWNLLVRVWFHHWLVV